MANLTLSDRLSINDSNIYSKTYYYEPVIANGGTQSDGMYIGGGNVIGVVFPAAFTGTALTAQVSFDGSTWVTLNGFSITPTVSNAFELSTATVYGWPYVRFVSGSAEGAERTLQVLVKEL